MWKVSNSKNKIYLDKFHSKIIVPLFDFIITLKENSFSGANYEDFETEIEDNLAADFPKKIFRIKYQKIECYELIISLFSTQTLDHLKKQKEIFEIQNFNVNSSSHSFDPQQVPEELYRIFSNILYSECFDDNDCWNYIESGLKYNRTEFHSNFKEENNDRTICSLCDTDTVIAKSNGIVEHFLPRNKFPYLSMNANNLTTCCNACNLGEEGKGSGSVNPIWAPFSRQIGDNIKFIIETDKIVISPKEGNFAIDNYIDLLKLNNRFATKFVFNTSINRLNAEISMHKRLSRYMKIDDVLSCFIDGLEDRKGEGLYFLKRNYFGENYKEYLEELKTI